MPSLFLALIFRGAIQRKPICGGIGQIIRIALWNAVKKILDPIMAV
jgi:hypothetical protein